VQAEMALLAAAVQADIEHQPVHQAAAALLNLHFWLVLAQRIPLQLVLAEQLLVLAVVIVCLPQLHQLAVAAVLLVLRHLVVVVVVLVIQRQLALQPLELQIKAMQVVVQVIKHLYTRQALAAVRGLLANHLLALVMRSVKLVGLVFRQVLLALL
jgi:hypothetical protein